MILSDNETRIDRLNNMAIAKTYCINFKRKLRNLFQLVYIGDWGAGKSSVLAMVEDELKKLSNPDQNNVSDIDSDYSVIRFNSWQYQGFEDAKIALMRAIVCQLEDTAKVYLEHHPIVHGIDESKILVRNYGRTLINSV